MKIVTQYNLVENAMHRILYHLRGGCQIKNYLADINKACCA
jgi:hypothetical protein